MPSVSSTMSGGGNLNVFTYTNSQTSNLPSCTEGGETILLPPYAQNSSSCHAYSFYQDDTFTSGIDFHSPLNSTSCIMAVCSLRQNILMFLSERDNLYQRSLVWDHWMAVGQYNYYNITAIHIESPRFSDFTIPVSRGSNTMGWPCHIIHHYCICQMMALPLLMTTLHCMRLTTCIPAQDCWTVIWLDKG